MRVSDVDQQCKGEKKDQAGSFFLFIWLLIVHMSLGPGLTMMQCKETSEKAGNFCLVTDHHALQHAAWPWSLQREMLVVFRNNDGQKRMFLLMRKWATRQCKQNAG